MQIYKNDTFLIDSPETFSTGASIIHYKNENYTPIQLIAKQPKQILISTNKTEFNQIKPIIESSISSGNLWVIATTYEWGVSQLGLQTPHANAIFIEYEDYLESKFTPSSPTCSIDPIILTPEWRENDFSQAILKAKHEIKEGHVYQINLSYPNIIESNHSIESLYFNKFLPQSPSHGAFINTEFCKISSCSPEEFFYFKNGSIRTQPIKGTIGRHQNIEKDIAAYHKLKNSEKDFAELTMITDLMRNDLSTCSIQSSVKTPSICEIVPFHYVYHLASTITAKTKPELTPLDLLTQLAPGGSITGCPKHSACKIIQQLESGTRDFYTGHIGFIKGLEEAAFNVAIRTCYQYKNDGIKTHSGCGITIESSPMEEYQESIDKLRFLMDNI